MGTLTHPTPETWELEMHHAEDNRLTEFFLLKVLGKAFDIVEKDWRSGTTAPGAPGALIIVGKKSQKKFFSNGTSSAIKCC